MIFCERRGRRDCAWKGGRRSTGDGNRDCLMVFKEVVVEDALQSSYVERVWGDINDFWDGGSWQVFGNSG